MSDMTPTTLAVAVVPRRSKIIKKCLRVLKGGTNFLRNFSLEMKYGRSPLYVN